MSETQTEITREEFIARFKARMIARAPTAADDPDGMDLDEYAAQAAVTYWDEPDQREEGPEACADEDMSCWEE